MKEVLVYRILKLKRDSDNQILYLPLYAIKIDINGGFIDDANLEWKSFTNYYGATLESAEDEIRNDIKKRDGLRYGDNDVIDILY